MPKEKKPEAVAKPAAKPKPTGEAAPPMGGNVFTAMLGATIFFVIATGFGFGAVTLELEATLVGMLPPGAEPMALPMAAAMFHIFVLQWLAMMVNNARVRYDVKWPWLYADKEHPHAIAYNCAQRAHQHVLEQTPVAALALIVASVEYPLSAGAGIALFTSSKIVGNCFGYASGNAKRRNWGAFGYIGLLATLGLAILATLRKFGVTPDAAVEHARPLAADASAKAMVMAQDLAAAAEPHVKAAMAKVNELLGAK